MRDARAGYDQTLAVLAHAKRHRPEVLTKSSLMLGLGETDEEILEAMDDLRAAQVDLLTLGQYLRPTPNHLPVERFVTPEQFEDYRDAALARGFRECVSGPLVRSSYRAEQALAGNNVGLSSHDVIIALAGAWCEYEPTWRAMQRFTDERDADTEDEIWLLEHPPVFTLGMAADPASCARRRRYSRGADRSGRAGDLSRSRAAGGLSADRHAPAGLGRARPGRRAGAAVIDLVAPHGVHAVGRRDAPGVYVDGRKLASVGMRIRRGASYHGLALNVDMDLAPFARINPCGMVGHGSHAAAGSWACRATWSTIGQALACELARALAPRRQSPEVRAFSALSWSSPWTTIA